MGRPCIILICIVFSWACARKPLQNTSDATRTDSLVSRLVERLDTVYLPGDSVTFIEYLDCDTATNKPKPVIIEGRSNQARVSVAIGTGGQAKITCLCDSLREVVKVYDKELFRLRHESKVTVKTVVEYRTRQIDIVGRWVLVVLLVLVLLYLGKKIGWFKFLPWL